ncbi:MAG: shikimate dehydrogenase [Rudanella sp.]|nr:shikimate dehydrogenase [Rudanella sp.]
MKKFGLIGYPLTHSFSKKYFAEKFALDGISDCQYDLYEMADVSENLPALLEMPGLRGLNVTIPHKQAVLPFLSRLDSSAEKVGAVNVIRVEADRSLTGFNSDYYGFRQSLEEWFLKEEGGKQERGSHPRSVSSQTALKALILGTGGASKAVVAALNDLGISHKMVSRTKTADTLTYDELPGQLADYKLIVNCSPVGTYPRVDEAPALPYEELTAHHWLYDLVYNPAETLFMRRGLKRGAHVLNGHQMLVLQAEKAWEIWQENYR